MGLTVLALIGGYAMATVTLGGSNSVQQGSNTTTISPVAGLTFTSTTLTVLGASVTNTSCPSPGGCTVTSAPATDCAGGVPTHTQCAAGDFVEQVALSTVVGTAFSGVVQITLYVTAGGTEYTGTSFYYADTSPSTAEPITQFFDVGSAATGPAAVTSVTVVAST